MKRTLVAATIAAFVSVGVSFAANPESDFTYELSDDAESIVITGFKNGRRTYDIPASIEGIPVTKVEAEFLGFAGVSEIAIKVPEGVARFSLTQIYSRGTPQSHITVAALPASLEECRILAQRNRKSPSELYITLEGSLAELKNLERINTDYVDFEEKSVVIRSAWAQSDGGYLGAPDDYSFKNSTIREVVFEEGCKIIGGFGWCPNLEKVTLPSSTTKLAGNGFCFCTSLSEIIIPESLGRMDFVGNQLFDDTALPLKTQARLRKLGYSGAFGNE